MIYTINKFGVAFAIEANICAYSIASRGCQVFSCADDMYATMDPQSVGYEYHVKQDGDAIICELEQTNVRVEKDFAEFISEYEI